MGPPASRRPAAFAHIAHMYDMPLEGGAWPLRSAPVSSPISSFFFRTLNLVVIT
jgi:hypothetical protein